MLKHLVLICALLQSGNFFSQTFYKNALVTDADAGIEVYNTVLTIHNKTNGRDTVQNDRAGNLHFTFGAEYGLHKNFGLGLRFRTDNYFVQKDTTGRGQETVKGSEILLQANYHPLPNGKSFDLVLGSDFGYSKINYNLTDVDHTKIWAGGTFFSFYVNPRIYIGRFAFNCKLYTPFFNYPNLKSNNENLTKDRSFHLKGIPGFGLNFGIQFRFLNEQGKAKKEEEKKKE